MADCYICCDDIPGDILIRPCLCNSYVHRQCIQTWIRYKNITKCTVCLNSYEYEKYTYDTIKFAIRLTLHYVILISLVLLAIIFSETIKDMLCSDIDCTPYPQHVLFFELSISNVFLVGELWFYVILFYIYNLFNLIIRRKANHVPRIYSLFFSDPNLLTHCKFLSWTMIFCIVSLLSYYLLVNFNKGQTFDYVIDVYVAIQSMINLIVVIVAVIKASITIFKHNFKLLEESHASRIIDLYGSTEKVV